MKYLLPLLLLLLMAMPAQAEPRVPLLDGYYLDMPRAKVQRRSQAEPCRDPGLEEHLCLPQAPYAGQKWRQVFMLSEGKLKMIVLQRPFAPANFRNAIQEIVGSGFVLAEIKADGATFDALAAGSKGQRHFDSNLKMFEQQAARARQLTYSFIDKRSLRAAGSIASLRAFLRQAPPTTRGITLSHNGRLMILTSLAPGA